MTEAGGRALEVPALGAIGANVGLARKVFADDDFPGIGGCWARADGWGGVNSLRIPAADSRFGVGFRPFEDREQSPVNQAQNTKESGTDKSKDDGHGRREEHEQTLDPPQKSVVWMWVVSRV